MKKMILILNLLFLCVLAPSALAYKGEKLAKHAKITIEEAKVIAMKKYPGQITNEELKRARHRGKLSYFFVIEDHGVKQRVSVDAKTGKILHYAVEGYQGK